MAPPSTLILGPAKSGTTALFYAIRAAMARATGQDIKGLFEPRDMDAFRRYFETTGDPVFLCKGLLSPVMRNMQKALDRFDRRIVIFRDPRDNIVSRLLFMPPRLLFDTDRTKCADYLDLIRRKQADPGSLSVLAILRALQDMSGHKDLPGNFRDNAVMPAAIQRAYGDRYWMFPYGDLIEGRFERLSAYLDLEVTPDFELGGHGHVSRSKATGEWRSWFLPEDIDFFVRAVSADYVLMGFDPDEAPDPAPSISPETSIDYATKLVERQAEKKSAARIRRKEKVRQGGPARAAPATADADAAAARRARRARRNAGPAA